MVALKTNIPIQNIQKQEDILLYQVFTITSYNNFDLFPFPIFIDKVGKYYCKAHDICLKLDDGDIEKEIIVLLEEVANKGIYYIPYTIHKTDNKKYIERINPIVDVPSEDINNYIDAIMWCINQNKQEPQYSNNKLLIHFAMTDESNYSNYNDIYDNSFYKLRNANIFQELDIREDKVKSDSQSTCGRTNRSKLHNSDENERVYRGQKVYQKVKQLFIQKWL